MTGQPVSVKKAVNSPRERQFPSERETDFERKSPTSGALALNVTETAFSMPQRFAASLAKPKSLFTQKTTNALDSPMR
jgi:hypothetical protein